MPRNRPTERRAAKRRARQAKKKQAQRRATEQGKRRAAEQGERAAPTSERATAVNSCGSCAACCRLLAVPELDKTPGQGCAHERRAAAGSCEIYETRPDSCRRFLCHWAAGGLEPDEALRPDRLGMMLGWEDEHEATGKPWFQAWEARAGALAGKPVRVVLDAVARDYVVAVMSKVPRSANLPRLLGPPADIAKITAWVDARR